MAEKQNGFPGAEALMKDKEKLRQVLASPEVRPPWWRCSILRAAGSSGMRHAVLRAVIPPSWSR